MRRRWIWDPKANDLVEVSSDYANSREQMAPMLMPDFEEHVSPIDGTVIVGRRSQREHMKRHNVTNIADYKETWEKAAKERARLYSGDPSFGRKERIEALVRAYDKHTRRK